MSLGQTWTSTRQLIALPVLLMSLFAASALLAPPGQGTEEDNTSEDHHQGYGQQEHKRPSTVFLQPTLSQQSQPDPNPTESPTKQQGWNIFQWASALFGWINVQSVIALATTVYAVFAILQWRAIRRQADIMVTLESPTIFVHGLQLKGKNVTTKPLVVIVLRNYGRSPAIIDAIWMDYKVTRADRPRTTGGIRWMPGPGDPGFLPPDPVYTNFLPPPTDPAVGEEERTEDLPLRTDLTDEQVQSIKDGTSLLWVFGLIHFHDLVDTARETGFCGIWIEDTKRFGQYGPPKYTYNNRLRKKPKSPNGR